MGTIMRLAGTLPVIFACFLFAAPGWAQPLPPLASYPPVRAEAGLLSHYELSVDMAEGIARAALTRCRQMGFRTTITVLDSAGLMKAFLRDEGTGPHTIGLSRAKAYTALTLASRFATSGAFATARNSTLGSPMSNIEGVVGVAGGVPIMYRGEAIGAVGSSGAVGGDKDEVCASAGIAAVADKLK
jgi:uncharacterized protein GlcG (DUF336 family)